MSHLMQPLKSPAIRRRAQRAAKQVWLHVRNVSTCRECRERILPWARVCHRCGAGSPFRVAVSRQLLLTAVACEIVLLFLNLRLG